MSSEAETFTWLLREVHQDLQLVELQETAEQNRNLLSLLQGWAMAVRQMLRRISLMVKLVHFPDNKILI